jgi:hypothetical protein
MTHTKTDLDHVNVLHRPRLLSCHDPCYLSGDLKEHIKRKDIEYIRGAPYHPIAKTERYHRSMKNAIKLRNYEFPSEL